MRIKNLFVMALMGASLAFTACEKDSNPFVFNLSNGVVITNEGSFGHANASISFYDANSDIVTNDIFFKANNRSLGDVLQSMATYGDTVYFVLNASNKIEVARKSTCKEIATIDGLGSPRFMKVVGGKGYVSTWTNNEIAVVNLKTNTVSNRIAVGVGPEEIAAAGNKLFVTNSGGWGTNNTVSVIDLATETVVKTITLADCPRGIVVDKNDNVWVLCAGAILYDANYNVTGTTTSSLCKINPSTYEVTPMNISSSYHPSQLRINESGDKLFYGGGLGVQGVYKVDVAAVTLPTTPVVNEEFYGFAIDPKTEEIFGMVAPSFSEAGKLKKYSATGQLVKEFAVGVGPNNGYFVK